MISDNCFALIRQAQASYEKYRSKSIALELWFRHHVPWAKDVWCVMIPGDGLMLHLSSSLTSEDEDRVAPLLLVAKAVCSRGAAFSEDDFKSLCI